MEEASAAAGHYFLPQPWRNIVAPSLQQINQAVLEESGSPPPPACRHHRRRTAHAIGTEHQSLHSTAGQTCGDFDGRTQEPGRIAWTVYQGQPAIDELMRDDEGLFVDGQVHQGREVAGEESAKVASIAGVAQPERRITLDASARLGPAEIRRSCE